MSTKPWHISRRTMLKGVGAMIGLPFLEAMAPLKSLAGTAVPHSSFPVRMAVLYMPNGVNPHAWTPQGAGRDFKLSRILEPLAGVKDDILVLTELWNAAANTGDGHYVKTGGFLTGTTITRTTGSNICSGGVSMDQMAAQRVGHFTALPSLELGIEPTNTFVDTNVGFTTLYGGHISWNTPNTPMAKEINPQLAFDRLFRSSARDRAAQGTLNRSVLDLALEDAKRLQRKLGKNDQLKLNEYLESVRAVERRIEFEARRKAEEANAAPLVVKEIDRLGGRIRDYYADPAKVSERRGNHTEHVRLMLDLMVLAFWSDSTRIGSFMFGNAVSPRNFSFLDGVSGGHHQLSHHEDKAENLEQYTRINVWHLAQYAYMLEKMKAIREGEGTLLDHSMILFGAGMRDGNQHNPRNLPIVLAGRGGGTLATGRHLAFAKNTPLTNLYKSMLARVGAPVEKFADSTGELPGLNNPGFTGTT